MVVSYYNAMLRSLLKVLIAKLGSAADVFDKQSLTLQVVLYGQYLVVVWLRVRHVRGDPRTPGGCLLNEARDERGDARGRAGAQYGRAAVTQLSSKQVEQHEQLLRSENQKKKKSENLEKGLNFKFSRDKEEADETKRTQPDMLVNCSSSYHE